MAPDSQHLSTRSRDSITHTAIEGEGGSWEVVHTRDWPVTEFLEKTFPVNPSEVRAQGIFESKTGMAGQTPVVFFKASPLQGKSARRYGRRRTWLKQPLPRMREFHNLRWLRKHLFQAPRPVAAGVWTPDASGAGLSSSKRWAAPTQQWLCTEWLEDYTPWQTVWDAAQSSDQTIRLERFAAELARLHALGFVHRDCFPRNLLLHKERAGLPPTFLDAWAGGPGWSRRGPAYDLACFSLSWSQAWSHAQQQRFMGVYFEARAQQGRPVRNADAFSRKVARNRAARWRREARSAGVYGAGRFRDGTIFS